MVCDEWMRRLGAQDEIKEEVLIGRYTVNTDCLLCGKPSVLVLCDRCAERAELLSSRGHLHKERVEPKP